MKGIYFVQEQIRCRRGPGKLSNNYCYTYLTKDQHAPSNLLEYSTIQCSTILIMIYDVISSAHKNVMVL